MPRQATVYTVVIASPSDTENERKALPEIVHAWNGTHSAATGAVLQPIVWEIRSTPGEAERRIVRDADVLVCVFWTRLGSPTADAEPGIVEEIAEFRGAGKRVLLYFSDAPAIPSKANRKQHEQLEDYRTRCQQEDLAERYDSVGELREKFDRQLTLFVHAAKEPRREAPRAAAPTEHVATPARPVIPPRAEPVPSPRVADDISTEVKAAGRNAAPTVQFATPARPVIPPRAEPDLSTRVPDDISIELKAAGWHGVQVGQDYYAWEGPLNDLPDRDPVEMQSELEPRLKKALEDAGARPSWQSKRSPLTWRDEQRLFVTDRRTYKRAIVCGNENVLVVRPSQ